MTIKSGGGNNQYSTGWHELVVSKAKYGEWNGTKCIDIYFDEYPENFNMRVYAKTGTDGEEFAIGQIYRFANAGISSALEGPDGTKVVKMDDSEDALIGKKMNVYFYKDGKYSRMLSKTAPTEFTNAVETFSADDVNYWKGKALDFYKKYVEPKLQEKSEVVNTSDSSESDEIPF
tara:strand:- start:1045 stop:1569 length:525 start_codon:yes stop_codon:yes gene_type:complete